jgi:hypothetical protein
MVNPPSTGIWSVRPKNLEARRVQGAYEAYNSYCDGWYYKQRERNSYITSRRNNMCKNQAFVASCLLPNTGYRHTILGIAIV